MWGFLFIRFTLYEQQNTFYLRTWNSAFQQNLWDFFVRLHQSIFCKNTKELAILVRCGFGCAVKYVSGHGKAPRARNWCFKLRRKWSPNLNCITQPTLACHFLPRQVYFNPEFHCAQLNYPSSHVFHCIARSSESRFSLNKSDNIAYYYQLFCITTTEGGFNQVFWYSSADWRDDGQ